MFRKVMQVSDDLMWRYYLLLTDKSEVEIAAMREATHPMEAKIALGKLIVADFHSAAAAEHAAEVFTRVVRRGEVPEDMPVVALPEGVTRDGSIRVDKLLAKVGLSESVSDAVRKIKAGAVEINGEKVRELSIPPSDSELVIQVGKNWRKVTR
jgi:tyrosyl-tRNA synthetase